MDRDTIKERFERLKRWWPAALAGVVLAALIAGPWAWRRLMPLLTVANQLKAALIALGPIAPVAYIALYAVQIVAAPVPGTPLALASGYVFGTLAGGIYSLVGVAIGMTIALALARRFGRPFVERLVGREDLDRWEQALGTHSAWLWFVIFLLPIGDAAYYLAGLSRARLRRLILAGVIARIPNLFLMSWIGAQQGRRLVLLLALLALVTTVLLLAWQRWGHRLRVKLLGLASEKGEGA